MRLGKFARATRITNTQVLLEASAFAWNDLSAVSDVPNKPVLPAATNEFDAIPLDALRGQSGKPLPGRKTTRAPSWSAAGETFERGEGSASVTT
jgi:hypothetical protein